MWRRSFTRPFNMNGQKIVFGAGCAVGVLICVGLNWLSYVSNNCDYTIDCGWTSGFPLDMYLVGGWVGVRRILWLGLFADILFAVVVGFLLGSVFRRVWSKIATPQL